jgi:putative membrane protein
VLELIPPKSPMTLSPSDLNNIEKRTANYSSRPRSNGHNRILVLCVDRDDDIGSKGGVKTPILGKDHCIEAGLKLAIEDPEDPDANAIFGAVKAYEKLRTKGYDSEVALVAGKKNRGIEADEKIGSELNHVLNRYHADAAVIISDGEDDEAVVPVIQTTLPVISVQRIIIKHSRSVEYSYAVLGRYIKMLVYDPRYSKFFLGLPGALLVVGGLATVFGFTKEALALVMSILGGAFIIRAFDLDKALGSLGRPTPTEFIRIFSVFAGVLIILVSIANGFSSIPGEALVNEDMSITDVITNRLIVGNFVHGTITLMWIGIGTILMGSLLSDWFKGSIRVMSDILRLVVLALLYIPILQFTSVLTEGTNPFTLISSLFIGLAITLIVATFLFQYFRNKKGGEVLRH